MTRWHYIAGRDFDALSAGCGGAQAVTALRRSRLSRTLLLLRYIVQEWPRCGAEHGPALAVLGEAQRRSPSALRQLLSEPQVSAWAARTARRLRTRATAEVPLDVDLAHLAAIAAVAAHRCGVDSRLTLRARRHGVHLPTLGRLIQPGEDAYQPVEVTIRHGGVTAADGTTISEPTRHIRAADGVSLAGLPGPASMVVMLDDVDPYRGGHHVPPAGRLSDDAATKWEQLLRPAWRLLRRHAPDRAAELTAGMRMVIPLSEGGPGIARSATSMEIFGAVGMTLPDSAEDFAVTLVHEFQHSKLSAVMDLVPLHDPADEATYYAPWRIDPRPIGGLLQGLYAFVGVADTWRALCAEPSLRDEAQRRFAYAREQVEEGLAVLTASTALTPAGRRLAERLSQTIRNMRNDALPAAVVANARDAARHFRDSWQRRYGRPV